MRILASFCLHVNELVRETEARAHHPSFPTRALPLLACSVDVFACFLPVCRRACLRVGLVDVRACGSGRVGVSRRGSLYALSVDDPAGRGRAGRFVSVGGRVGRFGGCSLARCSLARSMVGRWVGNRSRCSAGAWGRRWSASTSSAPRARARTRSSPPRSQRRATRARQRTRRSPRAWAHLKTPSRGWPRKSQVCVRAHVCVPIAHQRTE